MKTKDWHVLVVSLTVLWLFVRGVTLDVTHVAGELVLGLAFALPVAYFFRRLYPGEMNVTRAGRAAPYALLYVAAFLYELVTANVDVAKRVILPGMPIDPNVIEVPLRVQTPLAITTIANSITLTPGTLTMDHDETTNTLYVHAIVGTDREAVVAPIRQWEDYALVVFDEDRKPGDPVPDPSAPAPDAAPETEPGVDDETGGGETDGR